MRRVPSSYSFEYEDGTRYYKLYRRRAGECRTVLEMTIHPAGNMVDYLSLDRFLGRIPRPILW
jgi:hypothetical protein